MSANDVCRECCQKVNVDAVFKTNTPRIVVDGTSGCFKSSILQATSLPIYKVQHYNHIRQFNSFNLSYVGYSFSGLVDLSCAGAKRSVQDRGIFNQGEWKILWHLMGEYKKQFNNTPLDTNNTRIDQFMAMFRDTFFSYSKSTVFEFFRNKMNMLIIINSNHEYVDNVRKARNQGSDIMRSDMSFYTQLQNEMYKVLYPECILDIGYFLSKGYSTNAIIAGIAEYINVLLKKQPHTNTSLDPIAVQLTVPTVKDDLYMLNMTTHVYRNVLRQKSKEISESDQIVRNSIPATPGVIVTFDTDTLITISENDEEETENELNFPDDSCEDGESVDWLEFTDDTWNSSIKGNVINIFD